MRPDAERGARVAQASGAGKLILFGEHSVVYGEPAIAVPLRSGLTATAYLQPEAQPAQLTLPSLGLSLSAPPAASAEPVYARLWEVWELSWCYAERCAADRASPPSARPSVEVVLEGPLPFKVGLGSSAALGLALLQVCAQCLDFELSHEELRQGAWLTEGVFHDKPSGLDHTVALSDVGLCFQRREEGLSLRPLELGAPLFLALCWTPRAGGTAEAVQAVAALLERSPERRGALTRLGELSERAEGLLKGSSEGRAAELAALIDEAHLALRALEVSTPELEELRSKLKAAGALGAKLTGAGYGGAVFGLFSSEVEAQRAAESLGGLAVTLS